jgi:hypothetical protein
MHVPILLFNVVLHFTYFTVIYSTWSGFSVKKNNNIVNQGEEEYVTIQDKCPNTFATLAIL